MSLLPFDLNEVIYEELMRHRRPPDGLMHASSHLVGSLRHAQLDVAGAPTEDGALVGEFALWIGQMMHDWMHNTLRRLGIAYMAEVNLTPWLPPGWGGTADAVVWNPELRAFVLVDFKSQKGEGMRYILKGGAKEEHVWQTSAYWWGLKKMGLPLAKAAAVFYLPKNATRNKDDVVMPVLMDFEPLPSATMRAAMKERRAAVDTYLKGLPKPNPRPLLPEEFVTEDLAPVQPRTQRLFLDRATGAYELKLMPHWSTDFCPFPNELCDCRTQGSTKIGQYDVDGAYYPRSGYEHIYPEIAPAG